MIRARTLDEQRAFFDTSLAPLFEKRFVRWATSQKPSLYGLGIPPAQYELMAEAGSMAGVLKQRLERLACGFPLSENYFAWQAFGRGYAEDGAGPLPPYLRRENFDADPRPGGARLRWSTAPSRSISRASRTRA